MATFTAGKTYDLDRIELRREDETPREIAQLALDLASHTKALLGTLQEHPLLPDRDLALNGLDTAVGAIKRILKLARKAS